MLSKQKEAFIDFMLSAGVLRFGEFTTKSGRLSPYFVNTGNYKTGAQIATLGKFYASLVLETISREFDVLFGPAYKGIPLVTATAVALFAEHDIDKPWLFNRKEAKDHGEGGTLIGYKPVDGDRVIIIEDVVTAGTAVRETLPVLRSCGGVVCEHLFISVNRCEIGVSSSQTATAEIKEQFGIQVHALIDVFDLYEYIEQHNPAQAQTMRAYMDHYCVLPE